MQINRKALLFAGLGAALCLVTACASIPANGPESSAVQANILTHAKAGGKQPVMAERMTLAIRLYKQNKSIPPAQMRTTNSVDEE